MSLAQSEKMLTDAIRRKLSRKASYRTKRALTDHYGEIKPV